MGEDAKLYGVLIMEHFAVTVSKFLDKPYLLGGTGQIGFGCINFVYEFLRARGADNIKTDVDGVNLENYPEFLRTATPDDIKERLFKAFDMNGERVPRPKTGDCLVLKSKEGSYFPAIYAGGKTVVSSFLDVGVKVTPLSYYKLIGAWRI